MRYLSLLLLTGFVAIAVFGVFGMHTEMDGHDNGCIAATAQGGDCPQQSNPLNYFSFHLDAFENFSSAIFSKNVLAVLVALIVLAIGAGLGAWLRNLAPPRLRLKVGVKHGEYVASPVRSEFTHWLALHENSPAAF